LHDFDPALQTEHILGNEDGKEGKGTNGSSPKRRPEIDEWPGSHGRQRTNHWGRQQHKQGIVGKISVQESEGIGRCLKTATEMKAVCWLALCLLSLQVSAVKKHE
jgi:hypothetical protein